MRLSIVLAGPQDSGKETFITTVKDAPDPTRPARLADPNYGEITIDEKLTIDLFAAVPMSHPSHQYLWEIMSGGMKGLLILMDSTKPESMPEVNATISAFRAWSKVPYLIAANKGESTDAMSIEVIRTHLDIKGARIIRCEANERKSASAALLALVFDILENSGDHL